jgi:hypothetical protein
VNKGILGVLCLILPLATFLTCAWSPPGSDLQLLCVLLFGLVLLAGLADATWKWWCALGAALALAVVGAILVVASNLPANQ